MSKTAPIQDDVHALIVDKQLELKRRYKVSVKIADIIAMLVKNNINKVGEYLGFKNDEESKKDISNNIKQKSLDEKESE